MLRSSFSLDSLAISLMAAGLLFVAGALPHAAHAQEPAPDGQPTPIVGDPVQPAPQQPPPTYPPAQQPPAGYGYAPQAPPPAYGQGTYAPAPQPAPEPKSRPRVGLIIGGALSFGIPYIITALVAYFDYVISEELDWGELFIPAVGPLLMLPEADTTIDPLLVVDSVVQTAGLVMLAIGIFVPTTSNDVAESEPPTWIAYPTFGRDQAGIGVRGRF